VLVLPQQPGGADDFPGSAYLLRPVAGDEHAGVLEELGERVGVVHEQRVLQQCFQLFWSLPRGHGSRLEHEAVTLDDREGGIEVQVTVVPGGHGGEGLRVGRGSEAPERAEQLFQPRRGDDLQDGGRLVAGVPEGVPLPPRFEDQIPGPPTTPSPPSTAPIRPDST